MTCLTIKAIIFDLDGLVLDSETTYIAAWRQAASTMGYLLDEVFFKSLSGLHGTSVEQALLTACGSEFALGDFRRLSSQFWQAYVHQHGIPVKSGFHNLLKLIRERQLPYCLATNSRRQEAVSCLQLAGLEDVFAEIIARDDVRYGKPAPDIFIKAATRFALQTTDCLVLEDSPVGVAAAVAADCPCLYIPSTNPPDAEAVANAVAVLDDLDLAAEFLRVAWG